MKLGDIYQELRKVLDSYAIPQHVVNRIYVLLGDESSVYVDGHTWRGDDRSVSGEVVFFTASVVLMAKWRCDDPFQERPSETKASAEVRAWARARLTGVSIEKAGDGYNVDEGWDNINDGTWPRDGRLALQYDGLKRRIELPMVLADFGMQRAKLRDFIPYLLKDLN